MKIRYLLLFVILSTLCAAQTNDGSRYASSSVLATGQWTKISVDRSGIYRLDYGDIKAMGIAPENVRIYGYGGALLSEDFTAKYIDDLPQVPIYINKGSDGVFGEGDYILFYGQANISWRYDARKGTFSHVRNHYSDRGYYFVTAGEGEAKQIPRQAAETASAVGNLTSFTDYLLHEQDLLNLADGGREFYGEEFGMQRNSYDFQFVVPNTESAEAKMFVDIASKALNPNSMTISLNGNSLKTIALGSLYGSSYQVAVATADTITFTPSATDKFDIRFARNSPLDQAYLNYFEINFRRKLIIDGNEFYFRNVDHIGENGVYDFVLANASSSTEIWEITDITDITSVPVRMSGDKITWAANTDKVRQYVAVNTQGTFAKPTVVGNVANQNLHAQPQADMLIITNADFVAEANRLADYHRQKRGITVNVVDEGSVFNEFSSGTPDASAYRRYAKMFYDRGKTIGNAPQWFLLFGDGLYDNRGLTGKGQNFRRLLTYQAVNSLNKINAYTSDDYFAYLDDDDKAMEPASQMDIAIGRIPVYDIGQAKTAVDKTISYIDNNLRGEWKNRMLFIADDGDNNMHMRDCDGVTVVTQAQNPDIMIKKLYLDAYKQETSASTESYPMANNILDNYIKQGVLMINYMGHGSAIGWANEKLLTTAKIKSMINDKYPIFVTATCDFSAFDQFTESGGEQLIWNKTGGTMALITTTRTVYASGNAELNRHLSANLFLKDAKDAPLTIGEILRRAKNQQTGSDNKFAFTLLGDPSLRLLYPYEAKVVTDSINHKSVKDSQDTLSALSEVTVSGHIETIYGNKINGYNGVLNVSVFDKLEQVKTLANDKGSTPFEYQDRPNMIFRGAAAVEDGKWSFKFLVPKDIKYNFGTGRIVYYASENDLGMEANGSFENFVVGGENPNPQADSEGPQVSLFMNSHSFREGQKVNRSPLFIADLYDESGINTSGNGIGHDIVLKHRRDDKNEVILNDYYVSNLGDYKSGRVEYQLNNLEKGRYTLWFRVWDLQNNPTVKEISFEVSDDVAINADVMAYPNPATDFVKFVVEHDRPYKGLDIKIRVFDIVGRLVWQSPKTKAATSNRTEIEWNFASEGMSVQKGIYLVQLEISVAGEPSICKPIKLIIN